MITLAEDRAAARRNPALRRVYDHPLYPSVDCQADGYAAQADAFVEAATQLGEDFCLRAIAATCCTSLRTAKRWLRGARLKGTRAERAAQLLRNHMS